jgi:hypothetical protein
MKCDYHLDDGPFPEGLFWTYRWRLLGTYTLFNLENLIYLAQPLRDRYCDQRPPSVEIYGMGGAVADGAWRTEDREARHESCGSTGVAARRSHRLRSWRAWRLLRLVTGRVAALVSLRDAHTGCDHDVHVVA